MAYLADELISLEDVHYLVRFKTIATNDSPSFARLTPDTKPANVTAITRLVGQPFGRLYLWF